MMNLGEVLNVNGLAGKASGAINPGAIPENSSKKEFPGSSQSAFNDALKSEVKQDTPEKSQKEDQSLKTGDKEKARVPEMIPARLEHPGTNKTLSRVPLGLLKLQSTPVAPPSASGIDRQEAIFDKDSSNPQMDLPPVPANPDGKSEELPQVPGMDSSDKPEIGTVFPILEGEENTGQDAQKEIIQNNSSSSFKDRPFIVVEKQSGPSGKLGIESTIGNPKPGLTTYADSGLRQISSEQIPAQGMLDNVLNTASPVDVPETNPEGILEKATPEGEAVVPNQDEKVSEKTGNHPNGSDVYRVKLVPSGRRISNFVHNRIDQIRQKDPSDETVRDNLGKAVREIATQNLPKSERFTSETVNPPVLESTPQSEKSTPLRETELHEKTQFNEKVNSSTTDKPLVKQGKPVPKISWSDKGNEITEERPEIRRRQVGSKDLEITEERPELRKRQVGSKGLRGFKFRQQGTPETLQASHSNDPAMDKPAPFGHMVRQLAYENSDKGGLGQVVSEMAKQKQEKNTNSESKERMENVSGRADKFMNSESTSSSLQRSFATSRVASSQEAFMKVISAIERMNNAGDTSRLQLRLQFENGEEMKVILKYAKGLLQTVFRTESDGLRIAMREGWDNFQRQLLDQGVDADKPEFQNGRHDQEDGRDSQDFSDEFSSGEFDPKSPFSQNKKSAQVQNSVTGEVSDSSSMVLNAYA